MNPRSTILHRTIRALVRECLETWVLQAEARQVSADALEAILACATVAIVRQWRNGSLSW
jgi:hypothetical protein